MKSRLPVSSTAPRACHASACRAAMKSATSCCLLAPTFGATRATSSCRARATLVLPARATTTVHGVPATRSTSAPRKSVTRPSRSCCAWPSTARRARNPWAAGACAPRPASAGTSARPARRAVTSAPTAPSTGAWSSRADCWAVNRFPTPAATFPAPRTSVSGTSCPAACTACAPTGQRSTSLARPARTRGVTCALLSCARRSTSSTTRSAAFALSVSPRTARWPTTSQRSLGHPLTSCPCRRICLCDAALALPTAPRCTATFATGTGTTGPTR
mmetsp:Transcript_2371/g.7568  ORF Transcript_2371/g.7568 Transcript_2371/m.7568 type:complete len:274 (-) Transcript_2371:932-1753(-)